MRLARFALLLCLPLLATVLRAQAVHWENGDSALGGNVLLVFQDCEPDGDPELPAIADAKLSLAGSSTSMNIVNMSVSRTVTLSYTVELRGSGPLRIPAFSVKTNKGSIRVAAFNGSAPTVAADSVAKARLIPQRTTVWQGEVFDLTYRLTAPRRNNPQFGSFVFDWNSAPLVTEEWAKPTGAEAMVDGEPQIVVNTTTRAYAKSPGRITLEPTHQVIQIQTGVIGFNIFSQARMEPVTITSDQPTLEVRALPTPPAGFAGAVGEFKFSSKVVPKQAAVGEPITWTLELSGTGNWPEIPGLPAREVSKDFQVVQPKAKRTPVDGKLFESTLTEDVVLVPTKPGSYTLPAITFTFFNPRTGSYQTLRTEPTNVTIAPPPSATSTPAAAPDASANTESAGTAATGPNRAAAPAAPSGIPRDPLPGTDEAALPLTPTALVAWLVAPLGLLVLLWIALAWRHAAKTDPLRARREAHARIATLLAKLRADLARSPSFSPQPGELLQWQHDAAILFGLQHAAPNAAAFELAPRSEEGGTTAPRDSSTSPRTSSSDWAELWREADRALYGRGGSLPADWVARAEAALAARRVPGFKPYRLFLPRNLLAFAAVAVVTLAALTPQRAPAATATTPQSAYATGGFAHAESAWRAEVAKHPTDWIARHNLSLALTQLDRTGEAAAQATAAFVQHPDDPSVRWHFALLADKAGFAAAPLVPFLKDGPVAAVATLASPAGWQRLLILASFLVAAAIGAALVNAYGRRRRIWLWLAGGVALLAVLGGITSIFGLVAYGDTVDRAAVVTWQPSTLRSIPTEADTKQKTTALPAGSLGIVDRTYLGSWVHLRFANGQTGWVRQEEVVTLWR